ncbi:MAG: RagB/SusD family nutrient uptake outer membrane protein, partial [Candidatus Azobacteroides sp.]|nr:RagB/SusD family nutrient uptake outer membrane protein [Candidatus Azobacteroides sp.]
MKKIKYILLSGLAALMLASCDDLTLEPKGILHENELFGGPTEVQTYLAGIYMYLPIEDFNYDINSGYYRGGNAWDVSKNYLSAITGEAIGWPDGIQHAEGFSDDGKKFWPYDKIRDINTLLEKLPDYKSNYDDTTYNNLLGEARFLRAFYYFGMAKRYGGVPIVDNVQSPTDPADLLDVFRATESDTWKFIRDDLQFAMDNMFATSDAGRANKYVAAALMSRAMLYAGTIAKYGSYTPSTPEPAARAGYVGIPLEQANDFFNEAYNACVFIEGGNYELTGENAANKEQNYVDLFLQDTKEDIFVKYFNSTAPSNMELYHSYDGATSPSPDFSNWPGSEWVPTLETAEMFQKMPIENADGTPIRFNTREELWQQGGLEPRLLASIFFPGMELRGKTFDILRGIYRTYTGTMADAQMGASDAPINNQSNRAIGSGKNETFKGKGDWLPDNTLVT